MLPALGFGLHVATMRSSGSQLLDAATAFPALTLFQIVSSSIQEAVAHIMGLLVAFGSLQRIDQFLALDVWQDTRTLLRTDCSTNGPNPSSDNITDSLEKAQSDASVRLESVNAGWGSDGDLVVKDTTFEVPLHGLTAIAGASGTGKTTLLRVILGDITPSSGTVSISSGHIGYCDQTPWIANLSIRENIVGAFAFDQAHYHFSLEACALDRDLQDLAKGDEHICGQNGASLSGGQKVRLVSHLSRMHRFQYLETGEHGDIFIFVGVYQLTTYRPSLAQSTLRWSFWFSMTVSLDSIPQLNVKCSTVFSDPMASSRVYR